MSRRRRGRAFARAAALLAAACALGCATLPETTVPLSPGDPRPTRLLERQAALGLERGGLRATARVSLDGQRGASFARQILLLERPARLRVEVLGLLGQRIAVLATDGERYDLYQAETRAVERGAMHPAVLWDVAGVPLTPREAVALLLGAPALPPRLPAEGRGLLLPTGGIRLQWPAGEGVTGAVEFDVEGWLRAYRLDDPASGGSVAVSYDDYREIPSPGGAARSRFAHRVRLEFADVGVLAEIEFRGVELNPELPEHLFRLDLAGRVSSLAGGIGP